MDINLKHKAGWIATQWFLTHSTHDLCKHCSFYRAPYWFGPIGSNFRPNQGLILGWAIVILLMVFSSVICSSSVVRLWEDRALHGAWDDLQKIKSPYHAFQTGSALAEVCVCVCWAQPTCHSPSQCTVLLLWGLVKLSLVADSRKCICWASTVLTSLKTTDSLQGLLY